MKHSPKTIQSTLLAAAVAASCLAPVIARASLVLDTGTPGPGATSNEVSTSQWFAAEFYLSAGQTVNSLSAYLSGNVGETYSLDIFAGADFTNSRLNSQTQEYSTTGTLTTSNAWNTTSTDWTAATSGYYWLALEETSSPRGFSLNLLSTTNNGTAPAQSFAYLGSTTNNEFVSSGAPDVAFQVNATPVPLPAPALLLGGGLLGVIGIAQRRRAKPRDQGTRSAE
jgi:hypothetical protein